MNHLQCYTVLLFKVYLSVLTSALNITCINNNTSQHSHIALAGVQVRRKFILDTFSFQVIWRHKGERPSTLGNNTLIVDWMPQKDLLGHPQTKLFVAHGGTNGVQEAIYHGVPVLGIPLFFDQYDNLLRLQERGAGKIDQDKGHLICFCNVHVGLFRVFKKFFLQVAVENEAGMDTPTKHLTL